MGAPGVAEPRKRPARAPAKPPEGRKFAGDAAREAQKRAVAARLAKPNLLRSLGLDRLVADQTWRVFLAAGEELVRAQSARMAQRFGSVGPGPGSMLQSAGLQLAMSRWHADQGETERASRLANDSRQNILAAFHLAKLEADAARDDGKAHARVAASLAALTAPGGSGGSGGDEG